VKSGELDGDDVAARQRFVELIDISRIQRLLIDWGASFQLGINACHLPPAHKSLRKASNRLMKERTSLAQPPEAANLHRSDVLVERPVVAEVQVSVLRRTVKHHGAPGTRRTN